MKTMVLRRGNGLAGVIWESGGGLDSHLWIVGDVLVSFSDMKIEVECLCSTNRQYIVLVGKLSREATLIRARYTVGDLT